MEKPLSTPAPATSEGREEFEKWLLRETPLDPGEKHWLVARQKANGRYVQIEAQSLWESWCASRSSDRERVEELERELANVQRQRDLEWQSRKYAQSKLSELTGLLKRKDELIKSLSGIVEILRTHSPELARKVRQAAEIVTDIVGEDGMVKAERAAALRSHLESSK